MERDRSTNTVLGLLHKRNYEVSVQATSPPFVDSSLDRLLPAVPFGPLQRVAPEGGGIVCGKFIPAGTHVVVNQWAVYRDPRYFSEPDKFIPERWMPGQREKIHPTAFSAYSMALRYYISLTDQSVHSAILLWALLMHRQTTCSSGDEAGHDCHNS